MTDAARVTENWNIKFSLTFPAAHIWFIKFITFLPCFVFYVKVSKYKNMVYQVHNVFAVFFNVKVPKYKISNDNVSAF